MTQAQTPIKAGKAIERIGELLDEADGIITKGMMDAETEMRPSKKAASHIGAQN